MKHLLLALLLAAAPAACSRQETVPDAQAKPGEAVAGEVADTVQGDDQAVQPAASIPDPQTTDISKLPRAIVIDEPEFKADITFAEGLFANAPAIAMDAAEDARIRIDAMRDDARAYKAADPEFFRPYGLKIAWTVSGESVGLISLERFFWSDTGGAHGNYSTDGRIYRKLTGDKVNFQDLFTDAHGAMAAVLDDVHGEIAAQKVRAGGDASAFARFKGEAADGLTMDDALQGNISLIGSTEPDRFGGFALHFAPYELGSYAEGAFHITVPQDSFRDFLKPEFQDLFAGEPVTIKRPGDRN